MSDHILDSNILIRYLRKMPGYKDLLRETNRKGWVYISAMTRLEIVRGMQERERVDTFALLNSIETIQITNEIADLAGEMIRFWRGRGVILSDADALIAASTLQLGLTLVTTNPKHFPMPELTVLQADEQGNLSPFKAA
ncbi:MAG: type II toxin-antitoxin system VapC family toxin [Anaerolineales bacterium]|nr:type II toxin-antitoxin system VapC family toxin [Anaerolineales bacterium]